MVLCVSSIGMLMEGRWGWTRLLALDAARLILGGVALVAALTDAEIGPGLEFKPGERSPHADEHTEGAQLRVRADSMSRGPVRPGPESIAHATSSFLCFLVAAPFLSGVRCVLQAAATAGMLRGRLQVGERSGRRATSRCRGQQAEAEAGLDRKLVIWLPLCLNLYRFLHSTTRALSEMYSDQAQFFLKMRATPRERRAERTRFEATDFAECMGSKLHREKKTADVCDARETRRNGKGKEVERIQTGRRRL